MAETVSALVLQGGGALGAYELGAARYLYKNRSFKPGLIAGVSIGAISGVLLARPHPRLGPLGALEEFWKRVAVPGVPPLRQYASLFGNPRFFEPRWDVLDWIHWTSFYNIGPLRQTLSELVDLKALADPSILPNLIVGTTDVEAGSSTVFKSAEGGFSLDQVLASASLPPSFPMTSINGRNYWDGGLLNNTPIEPILDHFEKIPCDKRIIYVVNLFPRRAPLPESLAEVLDRIVDLQFADRVSATQKRFSEWSETANLMQELERLPVDHPIRSSEAFKVMQARRYHLRPLIVSITNPKPLSGFAASDFSPETIRKLADEGYRQTAKEVQRHALGFDHDDTVTALS